MSLLRAAVNKALEAIGTKNGTAPKESQEMGASFFDKRKDLTKDALLGVLSPKGHKDLQKVRQTVAETEVKQDVELGRGQFFAINAEIKTGASYLDEAALRVAMLKKFKQSDIDKMFAEARKRRDPSVSIRIVELGE